MSFSQGSVSKVYNAETETFRRSFQLTHEGNPIFGHTFDGSDTDVVLLGGDSFVINNHFYVTGEPLDYLAGPGNTPIGIDHNSPGIGAATTLPQQVYCIKLSENRFQVAAAASLAFEGSQIGLSTVGVGTSHIFRAQKENTKCIIALDNMIQSPLYPRVGAATTLVSITNRQVTVADDSIFSNYDLIQINDEIMRIVVVGYNDTDNLLLVDRAYMGTEQGTHTANDTVDLRLGDYNIIGDRINFADTPFGGFRLTLGISSTNVSVASSSFTVLTDVLSTGDQVLLRSQDPPDPLINNNNYFLIKNGENNFSFSETYGAAVVGIAITLQNAGIGTHTITYVDENNGSSFQGRAFIRSSYDGNIILDDLSQEFTGIAKTFTITSAGFNTTGITSDFGSILVNNIFQKPEVDYEFLGGPVTGITSIEFTGNSNQIPERYNTFDVNANAVPRKGQIVSLASSQGFGYQMRAVGVGTAVVSGFGTITPNLSFTGSGYRNGPTTYEVRVLGGNPTTAAAGTFTVDGGSIQNVFMNTPGVGYTWTDSLKLQIDEPIPYDDIQLISQSTGVGASITVEVGFGLSITNFTLNNIGFGFTMHEQLTIAGIPTVTSIGSTFQNAVFTVNEVHTDEFAGWVFGKLQILDDFSDEFNGSKRTFTLTENNVPISIDKRVGSPISLDDVLLIFINDILQQPRIAYTFEGGTQITFTEPPVPGSTLQVLFYRGTDSDISTETALATIKPGDVVKILKTPQTTTPVEQDPRTVRAIISRDTIQTVNYTGPGISAQTTPLRPITWCKQQHDKFVNGVKVSKSRPEDTSRVFPAARLITDIGTTDTEFYTVGGDMIFSKTEQPDNNDFGVNIFDDRDEVSFGTTTFQFPLEKIDEGVSVDGDYGIISGIGVTANAMQLEFFIPLDSPLRENEFGGILKTGISTGDFFTLSRTYFENGVATGPFALNEDRSSVIGTCTSDNIDCVYQVAHIEDVGVNTVRVHTNLQTGHNLNFTGLGSGIGNYYGVFSWAKFNTGSRTGLAFTCDRGQGLLGIQTGPQVIRKEKLSIEYS